MLSGKTTGEHDNWINSYEEAVTSDNRIELFLFHKGPEQIL